MEENNQDISIGLLLQAMQFAAHKHRFEHRKDEAQTPYINHPIQVAALLWNVGGVRDIEVIIAALLHDTVEDTATTFEEIETTFGVFVCSVVKELTDDKNLPKPERKQLQIVTAPNKSPAAKQIKLADKICNVGDIGLGNPKGWSQERQLGYVEWAVQVVAGLRGANPALEELFDQTVMQVRQIITQRPNEPLQS